MWCVAWRDPARSVRCAAAVTLALAALCISAGVAQAHGAMLASEPPPMTTVDTAPPEVAVYFTGALLPEGSTIFVQGPDGQPIDTGAVRVDGAQLSVPLRGARPAGTYTVFWEINAADGHRETGAFEFAAARDAGVGHNGPLRWLAPLSTAALLAGLALAVVFLWRSVNRSGQAQQAASRTTRTSTKRR